MTSHCGSISISLAISDVEHLFICMFFFGGKKNVYPDPLPSVKIGLFSGLLLSCLSSLCIFNISPLSDICFTRIFFPFCKSSFQRIDCFLGFQKLFNVVLLFMVVLVACALVI